MELQHKIWASLSKSAQEKLVNYYKFVLLVGMCKQRNPYNNKMLKKLRKWCVKKDLTIWDIPKHIYQNMQMIIIEKKMETPL